MKKLIILFAPAMLAIIMLSCSKDSVTTQRSSASFTPPPPPPSVKIEFASPWFLPQFKAVNDRSSSYLMARRDHESTLNNDPATHVTLAYVTLDYHSTQLTKRLPVVLASQNRIINEFVEVNFGIDNTGCEVTIKNADRNCVNVILENPFPDMQVRYIIIPRNKFESLNIDWDDYAAVAQALNI